MAGKGVDDGMPHFDDTIQWDDLVFEEEIGEGEFGTVLRGSYFGTPVAVKQIVIPTGSEEEAEALALFVEREKAMTKFPHPHLVQFLGMCEHEGCIYLVTEYVPGGDLHRYLKSKVEMTWILRLQVALDIARAMAFLHAKEVMHRDLKSKNLLVSVDWKIKVCDFGFARKFAKGTKQQYILCGTEDWMAPELILGMEYDEKIDVFSYGIVLCEIITRVKVSKELERVPQNAFGLDNEKFRKLVPEDCPKGFSILAEACCNYYSQDRPTFVEIITLLDQLLKEEREREKKDKAAPLPKLEPRVAENPKVLVGDDDGTKSVISPAEATTAKKPVVGQRKPFRTFKRSGSHLNLKKKRLHSVTALTQFKFRNRDEFYSAMEKTFAPTEFSGWVLLSYSGRREVEFSKCGKGGIPEVVENLKDDEIQYIMVRVPVSIDNEKEKQVALKTRDVFITWIGPLVKIIQRGQKKSHVGEVKAILEISFFLLVFVLFF
eukprot:TRINITY_DN1867_c0_g1_i3.p1 TRINITY_DN1867_c0_g1~~TRINITY_DN1867_c0_g1_i3.p1  ORF type:complete len:520 (-),score=103.10 TRINITY_DN1867_c0_g1_i3:254-1720(-)